MGRMLGTPAFLTDFDLDPGEARRRVLGLATRFGAREFFFYDCFADYSMPWPAAANAWRVSWSGRVTTRAALRACIQAVAEVGGRAWLYVQSMGAEEASLPGAANVLSAGRPVRHLAGSTPVCFVYYPDREWAARMFETWVVPAVEMGFHGILWDQLGDAFGPGATGRLRHGFSEFLRAMRGLMDDLPCPPAQLFNFVSGFGWDRSLVERGIVELPYWEVWTWREEQELYREAQALGCGMMAFCPAIRGDEARTRVEDPAEQRLHMLGRARETAKRGLGYLLVGDDDRRLRSEYWPDNVPLLPEEAEELRRVMAPRGSPGATWG